MPNPNKLFELSRASLVIIIDAIVKFALHMYIAPGYGIFFDELYTIALSRHLAFGYVDLPPLVPALVALSRSLWGESLFAMHIVPALAGSFTNETSSKYILRQYLARSHLRLARCAMISQQPMQGCLHSLNQLNGRFFNLFLLPETRCSTPSVA